MTTADAVLATMTASQLGFTTHHQLADAGLSDEQIANRLERRMLRAVHQGVYHHAAAPWPSNGRLAAAVLACGPGAVASHRSAASLHRLQAVPRWRPEVTVAGSRLPLVHRVLVHRTDTLEPADVVSIEGILATSIPRTLLDLGAVVPFEVVELAAQAAIVEEQVSAVDLLCVLERLGRRGRRGTASLRSVVRASLPDEGIESMLELDLQRLIQACPVPAPVLQHPVEIDGARYRLDKAWPELRIVAEADGRRWHSTRKDFERGMSRIRVITAAGWDHYRYGWNDVHRRPGEVKAQITAVIAAALASRP